MGLGGAGGVKNFSLGICDGAPSTARSSFCLSLNLYDFVVCFSLQNINWCEVITEDGLEGRSRSRSKAEQKREKATK